MKRLLVLTSFAFAFAVAGFGTTAAQSSVCGNCDGGGPGACNYPHDFYGHFGNNLYVCLSDGRWHLIA